MSQVATTLDEPRGRTPVVAEFHLRIRQIEGYEFHVDFEDKSHWPPLVLDEPPPLGRDLGPNAARMLAIAIGNCLGASLLFCLEKAKLSTFGLECEVKVELVRNERHRLRIGAMRVTLQPHLGEESDLLARCLQDFEDYCVVTESVRQGIDVRVDIQPVTDGAEGPSS